MCRVNISFAIVLDQDRVEFHYEEPTNGTWVDVEEGAVAEITFDAELLSSRKPQFSAFMESVFKFKDLEEFQRHQAWRRWWLSHGWVILDRLFTHYENNRMDLFDSEAKRLWEDPIGTSRSARLEVLVQIHFGSFRLLTFDRSTLGVRARERFHLARATSDTLCEEFARGYRSSGRMREMWRQLRGVHAEFVEAFPSLSPILQLEYWKEALVDLGAITVHDKRFDQLKHLYINCFEILCRVSVLGMAFEGIIGRLALAVPTRKGEIDLWTFESLRNANKRHHMSGTPMEEMFGRYMDPRLRNAVGHNATYYDSNVDEVVAVESEGADVREWRLPYAEFCRQVMECFSALLYLEAYFWLPLVALDGEYEADA
jgi:hypothetical protein